MKEEHRALIAEQRELRLHLGERAIDAFEICFDRIIEHQPIREEQAGELYDALVILVVRVLFTLYAEARSLLPNDEYSITQLALDLEKKTVEQRQLQYRTEQRLQSLWQLLYEGGDSLPAIGSDVFEPSAYPILLEKSCIDDETWHSIFTALRYHNKQLIEYSELHVEHIGSIHERLLEIEIRASTDGLVIHSSQARQSSGSHYTPRLLCDFLTERTLSPLLEKDSQASQILALRICDPAMGSGAFLLSACRYLGDRLVAAWRKVGLSGNRQKARQAIVKQCLYGVDINPHAIRVAKLCLWLESDGQQHLDVLANKCQVGNSVVGASLKSLWNFSYRSEEQTAALLENKSMLSTSEREKLTSIGDWFTVSLWCCHGGVDGKVMGKRRRKAFLKEQQTAAQMYYRSSKTSRPQILKDLVAQFPHQPFHWELQFAEVFSSKGGFDCILGNPPFINCIRGGLSKSLKECLKERFPMITGSADLSYYFLTLASRIIHSTGQIGLILPRVSLGASALQGFRASASAPKPMMIYSADHHEFFDNAAIKVVLYVFGRSTDCTVSDADVPYGAVWKTKEMDFSQWWPHYKDNWWAFFQLTLQGIIIPDTSDCQRLDKSGFLVSQGLTTGDFYKIEVVDKKKSEGLKLITSGSIDPQRCLWGKNASRFNGKSYKYPRIVQRSYGTALDKKLKRSKRPKVIVASLTREVEAFLDEKGECQASTATINIFHEKDDIDQLTALCTLLHSKRSNLLFTLMLEYNAMHSSISMEKGFLEAFPIPKVQLESES